MSNINIEDILLKHISNKEGETFNEAFRNMWFILDPQPSSRKIKAAIKEIIEAVVDRCAEEAEAILYRSENDERLDDAIVDKKSILKVKQQIDYE